jgi:Nucleoside 2-deoxyribosyltransferase
MSEPRGRYETADAAERMLRGRHAPPLRVYLAGKIDKHDWRHELVPGLRGALSVSETRRVCGECGPDCDGTRKHFCYVRAEWGEPRTPVWEAHGVSLAYAGPYFLSCDHGCYHGRSAHGVGATEAGPYEPGRQGACGDPAAKSAYVVERCLAWLRSADLVFAWLDDGSAYGTVAELGYAAALGTPIHIGLPTRRRDDRLEDMWFVRELAAEAWDAATPGEAFARFVAHVGRRRPAGRPGAPFAR